MKFSLPERFPDVNIIELEDEKVDASVGSYEVPLEPEELDHLRLKALNKMHQAPTGEVGEWSVKTDGKGIARTTVEFAMRAGEQTSKVGIKYDQRTNEVTVSHNCISFGTGQPEDPDMTIEAHDLVLSIDHANERGVRIGVDRSNNVFLARKVEPTRAYGESYWSENLDELPSGVVIGPDDVSQEAGGIKPQRVLRQLFQRRKK
ncbi:MAG TPA: hypothetical protein VF572_02785 [Candidatus Saccharimonadales bacterium]|jgi:hypothetical protein